MLTLINPPSIPSTNCTTRYAVTTSNVYVNFHPEEVPVPAGKVFEVGYIAELYGDGGTSADEIRQIGMQTPEAGIWHCPDLS